MGVFWGGEREPSRERASNLITPLNETVKSMAKTSFSKDRVVLCQTLKPICGFITFLKPHQS